MLCPTRRPPSVVLQKRTIARTGQPGSSPERESAGTAATSRLSEVEVSSGIVRRAREGAFTTHQRDRMLAALVRDVPALAMVEMTPEITVDARTLLLRHPLRAGDAIQLASGLYLQRRLARPVPFVAFDGRLAAARAEGLTVLTPRRRQPSTPARQDRSGAQ
jgi:uncharacterized protein